MMEVAVELREHYAVFDDGIDEFIVRHGSIFALGVADRFDECESVEAYSIL